MSETQDRRSTWRRLVGKPSRRQGIFWTILGLLFFSLGLYTPSVWWWVAGSIWLVLGIPTLVVAFSDHRHRRGRYVTRR